MVALSNKDNPGRSFIHILLQLLRSWPSIAPQQVHCKKTSSVKGACMLAIVKPTFFSLKFSLDAMLPTGSGAIMDKRSNQKRFFPDVSKPYTVHCCDNLSFLFNFPKEFRRN